MKTAQKIICLLLFWLIAPATCPFNANGYEDPVFTFRLRPPSTWRTFAYDEGLDRVFDAVSPDRGLAVCVRAVRLNSDARLETIRLLFEGHIARGALLQHQETCRVNGLDGMRAHYQWRCNGIPVFLETFFTVRSGAAYMLYMIVPEELGSRRQEAEAVFNTFALHSVSGDSGPMRGTDLGVKTMPPDPVITFERVEVVRQFMDLALKHWEGSKTAQRRIEKKMLALLSKKFFKSRKINVNDYEVVLHGFEDYAFLDVRGNHVLVGGFNPNWSHLVIFQTGMEEGRPVLVPFQVSRLKWGMFVSVYKDALQGPDIF